MESWLASGAVELIRIVTTVIDTIALHRGGNAEITTETSVVAYRAYSHCVIHICDRGAVLFIRIISTVIVLITFERPRNTAAVSAVERRGPLQPTRRAVGLV